MEDLKEFTGLRITLTVLGASQGWEKVSSITPTARLGVPTLTIEVIDEPQRTEI